MDTQIKSKERVSAHGEVFTNPREVNAMLDLVKAETERIDSQAKQYTQLQYEHDAIWAISSIYGIEILADNAEACRERLLNYFTEQYQGLFKSKCKENCIEAAHYILSKNIIHGDALTYKRVDKPDEWIHISEWSFIGADKVNRRDYEFSYLVGEYESDGLFSDLPAETYAPVHFLKINAAAYGEQ